MRFRCILVALTTGWITQSPVAAEVSFTGTYSGAGTTEEETREIEGLSITLPADQDDLLPSILPLIQQYREERSVAARTEATAIREVITEQEDTIASVVTSLLPMEGLSDDFPANYANSLTELQSVIDGWESWSGNLDHIHLYNRASAAPFWNEQTKVLDFGEIRYSFPEQGDLNLAILPPFIARIGAGVDKLKTDRKYERGFRWDIGLYAPPGVSAEVVAGDLAKLFPVLTNLQQEVAKQLGTKWIRYFLIERMLRKEIAFHYFDGSSGNRHLVEGLARLYLFGFLNKVEPDRMNILLPNLVHFPVVEGLPHDNFQHVEALDPLAPVPPESATIANRVLMLGLLKSSQSMEGDFFPLQRFEKENLPVPENGFNPVSFASAVRGAYPNPDQSFAEAAREIATLMRSNAPVSAAQEEADPAQKTKSIFPETYQKYTFGELTITAPSSLADAVAELGPAWSAGLEKTAETLRKRFNRKPVPAIPFGQADYAGLRRYGVEAKEPEVEAWLLQTAVTNNVEQAFAHLFDGNEIEIWFKDDLVDSLKHSGNTELFDWNESTGKVTANFTFSIPSELFRGATVEELLERYDEIEAPVFPIVITDSKVAGGTTEEKLAAIRNGDYLVEKLISGAEELSPGELAGTPTRLLDEKQTFFVVVHEVVEGYLIREVIGSPDRRWFCDGLANWIAMQECDRRFGPGTGREVMLRMFPPENSDSLKQKVNLPRWTALENQSDPISAAKGLEGAYYDFATRAMEQALAGKESNFIRKWLEEIRKTRWIRTHSGTVIDGYHRISEGDLQEILEKVVR
ncbi:MAG: hypothetical protein P1U87_16415 [Verrucomicrobiales bacterium]|nr:hypothetical protein [Verrucomicrobiales bacterium]